MRAAGISDTIKTTNGEIPLVVHLNAIKEGGVLDSNEASRLAIQMAGKLQQVDRNGTRVLWGITDEGDYRVVAAYDKNFKDVTTQFANATPQAITKWSQQVDQKYADGLQRKSTEIGNAFFAPYSTVTPAQAIAQLQREGIPGKLAESIVTNWATQREVIGQNSLDYSRDFCSFGVERMLRPDSKGGGFSY